MLRLLGAFSIVAGIGSAVVSALAWKYEVFTWDVEAVVRFHSWGGDAARRLFEIASEFTGGWQFVLLVLASAALLLLRKKRLEALFVVMSGGSGVVSIFLKQLVDRPRPLPDIASSGVIHAGASFPSNHVVVYTVFGGFLIWLLAASDLHPALKISGSLILVALIGVIDLSRVYTGVHWPSDVYGGTILGLFLLSILLVIYVFIQETGILGLRSPHRAGPSPSE